MNRWILAISVIFLSLLPTVVEAIQVEDPLNKITIDNATYWEYADETITVSQKNGKTYISSEPKTESAEILRSFRQKLIERQAYLLGSPHVNDEIITTVTFSNPLTEEELEEVAENSGYQILSVRYISTLGGGIAPFPLDHEKLVQIEKELAESQKKYNNIENFVLLKGFVAARVVLPSITALNENNNAFLVDVGPVEFLDLYPDATIIPGRVLFYPYNEKIASVDAEAPQIVAVEVDPLYTNSSNTITVTANITDNVVVDEVVAEIKDVKTKLTDTDGNGIFTATGVTPPLSEGTYSVVVTAYDLAGNSASDDSASLTVDNTPPTIDVTTPENNSYLSTTDVNVEWIISDNLEIGRVEIALDGGESELISESNKIFSDLTESRHEVEVKAYDLANTSASSIVVFTVDVTPPVITITGVENGSFYDTIISADIDIYDENLGTASVLLDGVPYESGSPITGEGTHVLDVYAEDLAGNNATAEITFLIDKASPEISINSPTTGDFSYTEDITLDYNATDDVSGVTSISAYLDDVLTSLGQVVDLFDFSLGEHVFRVIASDYLGNSGEEAVNFNVVDDVPPVVTLNQPEDAREYANVEDLVFDFNAFDEKSEVASLVADLDGTPVADGDVIDLASLALGEHVLTVTAVDEYGNSASESVTFTVILTSVTLKVTPVAKNVKEDNNFDFMVHVSSDYDLSGLAGADSATFTEDYNVMAVLYKLGNVNVKVDVGVLEIREYVIELTSIAGISVESNTVVVKPFVPGKSNVSASLKLNKRVEQLVGNGKGGSEARVTLDFFTSGGMPVKSLYVQEHIPGDLSWDTSSGAFTGYGLIWDVVEVRSGKSVSLEYTLDLPSVSEPTTYELRTVVEYQTLVDVLTLEETTYLTVYPDGKASLEKGQSKSSVKERGKGYSKVPRGSRISRGGGSSENKANGRGKGNGKPDKPPGKPDDPGKPDKPDKPK